MVEIIGYIASALIVVSFALTSVVRLRIVSFIGCIAFVTYGLLIGAWPVVISNAIIACLNAWYVYQELTQTRDLAMVPIAPDAPFLTDFLRSNAADIAKIQPGFVLAPDANAWLLNRDGLPAGVLVGRKSDDALHVDLDYVTPAYRDSRMGQFVYGKGAETFRSLGVKYLVGHPASAEHRRYLDTMHFIPAGDEMTRRID